MAIGAGAIACGIVSLDDGVGEGFVANVANTVGDARGTEHCRFRTNGFRLSVE